MNRVWTPLDTPRLGVAVYNFVAKDTHQLSLQFGDLVQIVEECSEWYRGFLYYQPSKQGIFPVSYVHLKNDVGMGTLKRRKKSKHTDLVAQLKDHLALEIEESLREWKPYLWNFFVEGHQDSFQLLLVSMRDLLSWHQNIMAAKLETTAKPKVVSKIDFINHKLGLNAVPRNEQGLIIDPHSASFHLLYGTYKSRDDDIRLSTNLAGTLVYKKTASVSMSYHLYFAVEDIDHPFMEDVTLFFRLYDADKKEYVSEPYAFMVEKIKANEKQPGGSNFHVSSGFQSSGLKHALFTDLGGKDLYLKNIYLVCHIVRLGGRMLYGERKYSSNHNFHRPYGCAVFDVLEILRGPIGDTPGLPTQEDEHHCFMPIFVCAAKDQENDFGTYHDHIIRSRTKGKSVDKQMTGISMLMRSYHGNYSDLCHDHPVLATKNLPIIHKLGFPDIILPGVNRNDVYITLEKGEYDKGTKTAQKNVEVSVVVVNDTGEVRKDAIIIAEGLPPVTEYHSVIYYHNNKPRWNEMFKLAIGIEDLPKVHIRFTFRHLAKNENKDKADKTFSFAYFKVMRTDGSIISDGQHKLFLYKAEHKKWLETKTYLTYVSCRDDLKQAQNTMSMSSSSSGQFVGGNPGQSFHETFYISIMTCSTKLTQKIELLSLLKWRQKEKQLDGILKDLMTVDGEEMVKFLQDTLDSLFEILVQNAEAFRTLVFDVLVHIIVLLAEKRYCHFLPVLDIYISKHFSATLAYKQLLYCLSDYVRNASTTDTEKLSKTLLALQYIFKFMIQSHILFSRNKSTEDAQFMLDLRAFFGIVNSMMTLRSDQVSEIHNPQNVTLLHLASVLPDIKHMFTNRDDTAKLVSDFLDSMRNTHHILPASKLQFILNVLDSSVNLLQQPTSRSILIPTLVGHLMSFVNYTIIKEKEYGDNSVRSMTAIGKVLESLHACGEGITDDDIGYVMPLLRPLLSLCQLGESADQIQHLALINFVALLRLFTQENYKTFLNTLKKTDVLKLFIRETMMLFLDIIKSSPYHSEWEALYLIQNRVILRSVRSFSVALQDKFFEEKHFSKNLCQLFFSLCMSFITQGSLKVELLSDYKKYKTLSSFGDMRVEMSHHVSSTWLALGTNKFQFIPKIISTILEMTLVKQKDVRLSTIPLIFDIILCEQQNCGNFKRVEKEVFDKLDNLFSSGQGDGEYKELFSDIMTQKSGALSDETIAASIMEFTGSVKHLIELILDYRSVLDGDSNKNKRMGCMLNLLNFYQEIDKDDLYIRYIYKLSELHERERNLTEAGFTLLLHADKLKWSEEVLPAEGKYPGQLELERKEQLYMEAIGFFNEGKTWECGIRLCKELAELYEKQVFDYHKLAAILETEARFFKNIITELRIVEPEYFRVSYYGKGFPYFLRNKTCIHRGKYYQKLGSFISTLTNEYPTAQVLTHNRPVDEATKNSNGMSLQICRVQPIEETKDMFKGKNVDINILKFYKVNDVRRFKFDRPFHKGTKDPQNEFATLWFERSTMTTSSCFPGAIDWFEVTESKTVELAPLEVAIETVEAKNSDLSSMVDEYNGSSISKDINPLSMLLNGVIDAAVQGGTVQYKTLFLTPKYLQDNPGDAELVTKLKACLDQQTTLCREGLDIHNSRITSSLQGLHQKMEVMYKTMCGDSSTTNDIELRRKSATKSGTVRRPLPETPLDKAIGEKSATIATSSGNRGSRAMSMMVTPDKNNKLSASNLQPKSMSVSTMSDSRQSFSPPLSEVCIIHDDDTCGGIYELTQQHDVEDYEFVDPVKMRASMIEQDDIYQVPTALSTNNSSSDLYGFDKLSPHQSKSVSPSRTPDRKAVSPLPQPSSALQEDVYSFDSLAPPHPRKKTSSSSSDKEDLHHIQYTKKPSTSDENVYGFDHLDTSKLQQRAPRRDQQKSGYDPVPQPVAKAKSPTPPSDDQDEYIEPIDSNVLEEIRQDQTYDKLSAVTTNQSYDHLPTANQQPPLIPKKKKVAGNMDSPVKPLSDSTYDLLHQERQPVVPVKNSPVANSNSNDDNIPPPLPSKRSSMSLDDVISTFNTPTKPKPLKDSNDDNVAPPLPSKRSSMSMDDVTPLPSAISTLTKPKPFRDSVKVKNPILPPRNATSEDRPLPKQRVGSQSTASPAPPPLPKKSASFAQGTAASLPQMESSYAKLGPIEPVDTGPSAITLPPKIPLKQDNSNKPRLPSPPPPSRPPKAIPSPARPAPTLPPPMQPQQPRTQPLVPKPTLPPKTKGPTQTPPKLNKISLKKDYPNESNA